MRDRNSRSELWFMTDPLGVAHNAFIRKLILAYLKIAYPSCFPK
jgi:hypothetical protein